MLSTASKLFEELWKRQVQLLLSQLRRLTGARLNMSSREGFWPEEADGCMLTLIGEAHHKLPA